MSVSNGNANDDLASTGLDAVNSRELLQELLQTLVECPICCDYLHGVHETPCCHTLFCESCIKSWRSGRSTCPKCRSPFEISQCTKNIPIQRLVDSIPVECPFKLNGCTARPPRSELEKHKQLCSFTNEKIEQVKQKRVQELNEKMNALRMKVAEYDAQQAKLNAGQRLEAQKKLCGDLFNLAQALYGVAQFKEALSLLEKAEKFYELTKTRESLEYAECLSLEALTNKELANYDNAFKLFEAGLKIASKLNNKPKEAEFLVHIGNLYVKLAKFAEATEKFNAALKMNQQDLGFTSTKTAEILNSLGLVAKKCSEYDKAIQIYQDALNIVKKEDPLWSDITLNLADAYRKKGKYREARGLYISCLKHLEATCGDTHPQVAEVCNSLGMLDKKEGKYNEALKYYKTALRISQHFFGKNHPSVGMYLTNLGDIYRKQGDFKNAESTYHQAIATLEKALGRDHVEVAEVLNSMGLVLKKRADYDGAEQLYTRAIQIITKTFGEKHYKIGIYLNNLADVQRKRGMYDEALKIYERALKVIEQTLGHTHSEAAEILHNMGLVQHQLGKYQEAITLYASALQIVKKEFGENHYKVGMFLNNSGLARAMVNDFKTAYDELKQALQILIACLGENHIEVADCYANLGDVCMKLLAESNQRAKVDEAKKYYTQASKIVHQAFGPDHTKSRQFDSLLFICDNYYDLSS
mmetsp:Transcript_25841/g.36340  ORF Transcript_25841/g.36340 Transcript_25841/m.36340 type:complete len:698 (-) Transcript_25841:158-2251(-)